MCQADIFLESNATHTTLRTFEAPVTFYRQARREPQKSHLSITITASLDTTLYSLVDSYEICRVKQRTFIIKDPPTANSKMVWRISGQSRRRLHV